MREVKFKGNKLNVSESNDEMIEISKSDIDQINAILEGKCIFTTFSSMFRFNPLDITACITTLSTDDSISSLTKMYEEKCCMLDKYISELEKEIENNNNRFFTKKVNIEEIKNRIKYKY